MDAALYFAYGHADLRFVKIVVVIGTVVVAVVVAVVVVSIVVVVVVSVLEICNCFC